MKKLILSIPFTYFYATRIKQLKKLIFPVYAEWLLGILILIYFSYPATKAITDFFEGYIIFISIYELGYIANDFYSVKQEDNPRRRSEGLPHNNSWIAVWVISRLLIAAVITYLLGFYHNTDWLICYAILLVMLFTHNVIRNKQIKTFTFINLAFGRFFLPLVPLLTAAELYKIIPGIFINYILYRTFSYMDSKDLLNMPARKTILFKLNYYILLMLFCLMLSVMLNSYESLYINIYFLLLWIFIFIADKVFKKNITI